jgi:hypothetical protein
MSCRVCGRNVLAEPSSCPECGWGDLLTQLDDQVRQAERLALEAARNANEVRIDAELLLLNVTRRQEGH